MKHPYARLGLLALLCCTLALAAEDAPSPGPAPSAAEQEPAGTAPVDPDARPPVASLDELLGRVRAGSAYRQGEEQLRNLQFQARKEDLQSSVEATRAELAAAREQATALEKQWEQNDRLIAEQQVALKERLGVLAEVFTELDSAGTGLRARLHESLTAAQLGVAREEALDRLLDTAASAERLPSIEDFDALWFELQRELAESGRVRRFDAGIAGADGRTSGASVVRVGNFNLVTADGRYLEYDADARSLRQLARQPADLVSGNAATLAAAPGTGLFGIDPGGAANPDALRAAAAAPTLRERFARVGLAGWLAVLLGFAGTVYASWRVYRLQREHGRGVLADCMRRLQGTADAQPDLDAISLEVAMDEAVLHELPVFTHGLGALRAIGTLAPLLGVLGTVLALVTGTGTPSASGSALAGDLAQALLSTVLGLCAGIPVLVLQAWLVVRSERLCQALDEQAAALVSSRAFGSKE